MFLYLRIENIFQWNSSPILHTMMNSCFSPGDINPIMYLLFLIGCGGLSCDVDTVAKAMVSEAYNQLQLDTYSNKCISFIIEPGKTVVFDTFCQYLKPNEQLTNYILFNGKLIPGWEQINGAYPLRVDVSASSEEYYEILGRFRKTMLATVTRSTIRIERIQNERLYRQYQIEKRHFYESLQENTEKTLYHGCRNDDAALCSVMQEGFDRGRAGEANGKILKCTSM
jgi:hypothetical protein